MKFKNFRNTLYFVNAINKFIGENIDKLIKIYYRERTRKNKPI